MTHLPATRRRVRTVLSLAVAALLAIGCGGGVGSGGTGSPVGVQSFSQGPISGFGSIIVNGVHYDDATAAVLNDDGDVLSSADLRLGTTVDLQATDLAATTIRVHVDIVGAVSAAYDATTGRLDVLGEPVLVDATTALDEFAGGAASIPVGEVVAVSSLYDPVTGVYVATRIDHGDAAAGYALRGAVASLDTSAHTFAIGPADFTYGDSVPPAGFADGQLVRVKFDTVPDGAGRWIVTSFGAGVRVPTSGRSGELNGVVGALTDATHYVVGGVAVDASAAPVTPAGAVVALQARVEVHGTMAGSVLVASSVEVEATGDDDGGQHGGGGGDEVEIDGPILSPIDTVAHTFVMRGPTTINYTTATFSNGTAADLAQGRTIEMKGALSADGTQVVASEIKFED